MCSRQIRREYTKGRTMTFLFYIIVLLHRSPLKEEGEDMPPPKIITFEKVWYFSIFTSVTETYLSHCRVISFYYSRNYYINFYVIGYSMKTTVVVVMHIHFF